MFFIRVRLVGYKRISSITSEQEEKFLGVTHLLNAMANKGMQINGTDSRFHATI